MIKMKETQQRSRTSLLSRYFVHGILFSILLSVLALAWVFIAVMLVAVGFIIGFIIGVVVLFFMIGGLNVVLTSFLWDMTIESNWTSLLGHGFILLILLLVVAVPQFLINIFMPSLATTIVLFLIYCFINGYVAKNVAAYWEYGEE